MPERIYWDSCVFIDRIQHTPGRIRVLRQITELAQGGKIEIVTPTLGIAEVTHLKASSESVEAQQDEIRRYFLNAFIIVRQLDRELARQAAVISKKHGLTPSDAVHVVSALDVGVVSFHTYDERVLKKNGAIDGLAIEQPSVPASLLPPSTPHSLFPEDEADGA